MSRLLLFLSFFLFPLTILGQPAPPKLYLNTEGRELNLYWPEIENATGYRLLYAPYPYQDGDTIHSIDMGAETYFSVALWQEAAFYVAIQAYDKQGQSSEFSNIGFFLIQDRGADYRHYWRSTTREIVDQTFTANDFLYATLPTIDNCFAGTLNEQAQSRLLEAYNQTRLLHQLSTISYDSSADSEVQQAALIQRANNFLTHTPATNAVCYSDEGFNGSNSSNLYLGNGNSDPANEIVGLIDDAFNLSNVAGVGHRRGMLNPFLQFTSYGQVFGAAAVKVFDFTDNSTNTATDIPDYVAFPYLRYPYVFFSDKSTDKTTPWNLSIIEEKSSIWNNQYDYFASANLTVTRKDNAQEMIVRDKHTDTSGFGIPNNLSWTVSDWQYDTWYTVSINNIHYASGETGSIKYDVFIDYKNIIDLIFPLEEEDQQSGTTMQGTLFDKNDKDSFVLDLEGSVTFSGASQFSNMAFYIAVYGPDKQLIEVRDEAFTLDLSAGEYTLVISNCHNQTCYTQQKNYTIQIN